MSHEKTILFTFSFNNCLPLSTTQSPAQQNTNPLDDLFDDQRGGLFLGGTVSYGIT